tara:strand:+ start:2394 stop:2573 length:180 start_codon:yes stop_codon:yes gene_type:complete
MKDLIRKIKYIFNQKENQNVRNYKDISRLEKKFKNLNFKSKIILEEARQEKEAWERKWM